jgi:predicted N-formylglutamate amidohydrolase
VTAPSASCLVTCEHAGREVPERWRPLFAGDDELLASHRGWDPGSRELGEALARRLGCALIVASITRLLVELNRSPGHPELFSERTRGLSAAERTALLEEHYFPYRHAVEAAVAERAAGAGPPCLHLSAHSFTPLWEGRRREVGVGLLFDPARPRETAFCRRLRDLLERRRSDLAVRFNEPYLGVDDGLTTHLRGRFPDARYLGIELEVNQRFPLAGGAAWGALRRDLAEACAEAAESLVG